MPSIPHSLVISVDQRSSSRLCFGLLNNFSRIREVRHGFAVALSIRGTIASSFKEDKPLSSLCCVNYTLSKSETRLVNCLQKGENR